MPPAPDSATREVVTPGLAGQLTAVSLFDLCQFLMLNRKSGKLSVRSGGGAAYLAFSEGQLCSAVDDSLREGAEVVLRIAQWTDGAFDFVPGAVTPERRMEESTENILLEAARRIDEMQAEARAAGKGGALSSVEQAFREKQARAASIAAAFVNLVAEGAAERGQGAWRRAALDRLLDPAVERLVLSAEGRAAFIVAGRVEEIPEATPAEVAAWMEQLAPVAARATGRTGHARSEVPEARPGPDGLWGLRVEAVDGDLVLVSRASRPWPGSEALPLRAEEQAALDALAGGLVAVLGACGSFPSSWPAWAATASWMRRRSAVRPGSAWVVEELPRYDWPGLPGRWRRVVPGRLRRPGSLVRLVRSTRASTLVFDGLPSRELLEEAARLADAGVLVVVVDGVSFPSAWLAAAACRSGGSAALDAPRFSATIEVRSDGEPKDHRVRARLHLPSSPTRGTPTNAPVLP